MVLMKIECECETFLAAQQGNASEALFNTVEGNYAGAIRSLTTTYNVPFTGHTTLFVAECTLIPGVSPEHSWPPWISSLDAYRRDYTHVDIISPTAFEVIGPVIDAPTNKSV